MAKGRRIRVRGQVQGVGYRPFVWQLAQRMGLSGWVLNDAEGVLIEVVGRDLDAFETALRTEKPGLARVDGVESVPCAGDATDGFEIRQSGSAGAETRVTPDAATCPDCAQEIRQEGRRRGYAFTNCTNCGPRFTILTGLPYDRAQTTMAAFPMCEACAEEYGDPADRRFHAQPVACPDCGPVPWHEENGTRLDGDPIALAAEVLLDGGIVAIRGLGGFHLACDATNPDAIATLRDRKRRPAKPFALMAPMNIIRRHAAPDAAEIERLTSPAAPVVLLHATGKALPEGLAPGQVRHGWMLPYTPLHHLLCDAVARPLVMTSGNLSGEPQAIGNDEAREKLSSFSDAFLMHDREIARRLDDSVEVVAAHGPMVLRRARGLVPGTIALPPGLPDRQVLACGGQMKAALCLVKNGQALLGHHLGELDEALTWDAYQQADRDYAALFDHQPEAVAVDLHPDFRATRHGIERAEAAGIPLIRVQHHHAHMAATLGEAGWQGENAVGIILDGLGLGVDGTVWGGEVLVGGYVNVRRAAWLRPAPLIGGDRAQSEPWRNALVRLDAAGRTTLADALFPDAPRDLARTAARSGINAPASSSAGRLFDAVAACLGLSAMQQSFEGEAAMQLEALAHGRDGGDGYDLAIGREVIDPAPLFCQLASDLSNGCAKGEIAARFQSGLARAFATVAASVADETGTRTIALSGGCFQNTTLLSAVANRLSAYDLCLPGAVPANDGGLAYGQALVALAQLESN